MLMCLLILQLRNDTMAAITCKVYMCNHGFHLIDVTFVNCRCNICKCFNTYVLSESQNPNPSLLLQHSFRLTCFLFLFQIILIPSVNF